MVASPPVSERQGGSAAIMGKRPWEPLYDAVAFGMWLYSLTAFRVEVIGEFEPTPGCLLVSTHRAESDVPIICPSLYIRGGYIANRDAPRLWFAARDDMFDRGFFAGFPPSLPLVARRALYPLRAGSWLPRVRVAPVPYPSIAQLRLGRALEELPPGTSLAEVLPGELTAAFAARATDAGLPAPRTVRNACRGVFADLLWRYCEREELAHPAFEEAWRRRRADGAAAIRGLIELHRSSGEMLLVFPEGQPALDGTLGPLQPGLDLLARRSRASVLVPLALAYDPLTPSRTRVSLAVGPAQAIPDPLEPSVLAALRRTMPLTAGQVVAAELVQAARRGESCIAAGAISAALATAVEVAQDEGRPIQQSLLRGVGVRCSEALGRVARRGLVTAGRRRLLELAAPRILADEQLLRLAREYHSAREL